LKEAALLVRRMAIGLADRFKDLGNWLAEGEAAASEGYLASNVGSQHRPSRAWFGQVMPGSWAPNVDSDGVDGKIAGVAAIHAHDPAFDENVFLAQVQRLFFAVLEAWTALKPALSQGVMASLIWEEQKAQVTTYTQRDWRNVLDKLSFTSAVIAGALSTLDFDTVTVRINATSADYDLDAAGAVVRGDTNAWDWTEDWIFQRPSTLVTGQPGTITSQSCPNCGASVNVDITSICPFCDAAVISGKFGWLLTRIDRI
jgi:predicted lipid-binding transport protein (Tim44 family)